MKASADIKLLCGYRENFLGCDVDDITLSVRAPNVKLNEYRAVFSSSLASLENGIYDLWETKIPAGVREFAYGGKALRERQKVYWRILFGKGKKSSPASFETGIRKFSGKWIASDIGGANTLLFKKIFDGKECSQARLYICGLGFFQAKLNGVSLDDRFFKPLFTDYTVRKGKNFPKKNRGHRITYYTYDITELLGEKNTLEIEVANGWFCNEDKLIERHLKFGVPKVCFDLYADGALLACSGQGETVRKTAVKSTLYKGDFIDFTQTEERFENVKICAPPSGKPVAPQTEDDFCEKILNAKILKSEPNSYIYDFSENHSGAISFMVRGEAGATLKCSFFEIFRSDGSPNMMTGAFSDSKFSQTIFQQNEYVLSGGIDKIEPLFSWRGYRYVEISCPQPFEIKNLQSHYIHTKIAEDALFHCSENIFNELFEKFIRTQKNNMHAGVPSDCPHREKLPYTGDGQLCAEASMYCFDAESFYAKWLDDIIDAQTEDGFIPHTAPNMGGGGGYSWGNALFIVAMWLYRFSGNKRYLEKTKDALCRWVKYYSTVVDEKGIVSRNGHNWFLGDWLTPEDCRFDVRFMSTICYYNAVNALIELKKECNECADEERKLIKQIRKNILREFYDAESGNFCSGTQGENVLPLYFGILQGADAVRTKQNIATYYSETRKYRIDTGIVATPVLIDYLTDHGMEELAYRIMTDKASPSYAAMMTGESTLCECWGKKWPSYCMENQLVEGGEDCSHDHPMFGSVTAWLFRSVAGLDLSELYRNKILFVPKMIRFLTFAQAEKQTRFGKVSIEWERRERLVVHLTVPQELKGVFKLPLSGNWILWKNGQRCAEGKSDGVFRKTLPEGKYKIEFEGEF